MFRWLYSFFLYLISPLILLRLIYRASKASAYKYRIAERFGFFTTPDTIKDTIWVHAVSVGETIAAAPMIERLKFNYPDKMIVVTTMTPTGSERVKALFGESVFHVYAPYDFPDAVWRFLNRIKPSLFIIIETELWPNMIYQCHRRNIPVVLANARLSEKSAAGYHWFSRLAAPMLEQLSIVAVQYNDDASRFLKLGLPSARLVVTGSIKFDIELPLTVQQQAAALKAQWSINRQRLIIIAASTHQGEDEVILNAFKTVLVSFPSALLVIVPRHPERFDDVVVLSKSKRLKTIRRSDQINPDSATQVLIGDTMGELLLFYGCADIAFVGGSLVSSGGHNMLEPAIWGLPIITGNSDFNFLEISQQLQQHEGIKKITDGNDLANELIFLLGDEKQRKVMGDSALAVIEKNRGSLDQLMSVIDSSINN